MALTLGFASAVFGLRRALSSKSAELIREKEESARRLYEVSILKEIGEQTGYSLDVEQILQIIAGSLHQFINYCAVSYIVVLPDKLKLHTRLEQSVSNIFLADLKTKMLASLSALAGKDFKTAPLAETLSGVIVAEAVVEPIGSFFNIPLTISGSLSGLLTVAHVKPGLYKEADMTILYKIVNQASLAVTRLQAVVKKEEERIGKIREEFTSMIVHELRSPLDGIRKIIELFATQKILPTAQDFGDYIKLIYQSATSMLELVNDILDYSKFQAGKFDIHKEAGNLREVIKNRIDFYRVSAQNKKIKLASFVDDKVPTTFQFDAGAIKQVFNNFLSNALKFTPEGGLIEIRASLNDKFILVSVTDTGIGIPKEKQKDLFLKYKQIAQSPVYSEEKGTGLGLVIAKGIVESHSGSIGATSVEKQGSVFHFTLPVA